MATSGPVQLTKDPIDVGTAARLDFADDTEYEVENVGSYRAYFRISDSEPTATLEARSIPPGGSRFFTPDGTEKVWMWSEDGAETSVEADPA